jgi:hypothetical protein
MLTICACRGGRGAGRRAQRVAVTTGGPLSVLPASVPAGAVQLTAPGAGLAWSLNYPGHFPGRAAA